MDIVVDFDATCADHVYPRIGQEVPGCIRVMKSWIKRRDNIILSTMRSSEELDDAVKWLAEREIHLYGVQTNPTQAQWTTSPKCLGDWHVDDRNAGIPLIKYASFNRPCVLWETVTLRNGTKILGVEDLYHERSTVYQTPDGFELLTEEQGWMRN